ncbi:MAG: class SAM-dependent methyltransferase [Proteobacteria bacterium]|nr:class SAM-dependent methyltransferase [Pseudomonadota bacterium]
MSANSDVQRWWTENPMTYGATHGRSDYLDGGQQPGSLEFFDRLDREFYSWNKPLHKDRPFDRLFPYDRYGKGRKVLEIGCGLGTMAMNWTRNGVDMTAVDLNMTSITQSRRRFELLGLEADIRQMDATRLEIADGMFDYAYSWGVLHHSPNLGQSLAEMMRVTKPGGEFGIMLYNRRSFLHWYMTEYLEGYLHYENEFLTPLQLASRYSDGGREEGNPHTWPVTADEVMAMLSPFVDRCEVAVLGTDLDSIFKYLIPGVGMFLPGWAKKPWARRFGWSLWITGSRKK